MHTFINSLKELSKLRNSASESEAFLTSTIAALDFRRISRPFFNSLLNACSALFGRLMRVLFGIMITFFLESEELANKFFEELKLTGLKSKRRLRVLEKWLKAVLPPKANKEWFPYLALGQCQYVYIVKARQINLLFCFFWRIIWQDV